MNEPNASRMSTHVGEDAPEPLSALLLDDNLMSATRIQAQLNRANYQVETARALPLLETFSTQVPHLVVINLGSRGMDGVALIEACRERFAGSRVVGFCGHLEVDIRRRAKTAGIDKILTNDQAFSALTDSLQSLQT